MTKAFDLTLSLTPLDEAFAAVAKRIGHTTPLMAGIAAELLSQTEVNFAAGGRPAWPELSKRTRAARERTGHWPGPLLQVSGALARSVTVSHDMTFAMISTGPDVPYAAIQQFGGKAGKNQRVTLPARPYLPFLGDPSDIHLQPEAERAIVALARAFLITAASSERP